MLGIWISANLHPPPVPSSSCTINHLTAVSHNGTLDCLFYHTYVITIKQGLFWIENAVVFNQRMLWCVIFGHGNEYKQILLWLHVYIIVMTTEAASLSKTCEIISPEPTVSATANRILGLEWLVK